MILFRLLGGSITLVVLGVANADFTGGSHSFTQIVEVVVRRRGRKGMDMDD